MVDFCCDVLFVPSITVGSPVRLPGVPLREGCGPESRVETVSDYGTGTGSGQYRDSEVRIGHCVPILLDGVLFSTPVILCFT